MALSRELLKRLNSEDDPLPKRLKVAEIAFYTENLPLVRKEDILLDWLCKICTTNQYAWKTLKNCLKSVHIDVKANVKKCLIDTLVHALDNYKEDTYEEILECCSLVFANNSIRQYLISKPKELGSLLKTVLNNILKHSNYNNIVQESQEHNQLLQPCKLSSVQSYTIINIIGSIIQIYKQPIATKEEIRLIFIHDILYPMCNIIDHRHTDSTNKLGVIAYKCIQQLLFGKSKPIQNKQATECSHSIFPDLFCILSKNVKILSLQSNLLTYLFVFRAAIGTYKSDVAVLDTFFRNLINSTGKYKWEILNASLKLLNDVTFDFENTIENVTLSEYLQILINEILIHDDITCVHYGVLAQLAYINPFLIEKNIPNILNKIPMYICVEKQTPDYINLLIAILHASTKLRREQKFISQLLISLKQHIAIKKVHKKNASIFLLYEFKIQLAKSFSNFASSQVIASLKTLLYYLNTDCAELLESNTSCKNLLMLKATVDLFVILLESIQMFEYARILSSHEKFIDTLNEIGNILSLLINKALCLSHNKNVIIILLTAVYSLSEMQNLLKYYVPQVDVTKKLLFPIPDDPWQQLIQRISNFGEDNCKNIMNKLILHRIKLNISNEPIKLHKLIGGLEYSWNIILKHDPNILLLLREKEVFKVTYLLLADMTSNETNFHEWLIILDKECIQENKCFVMCFLSHILAQIGQCLSSECTKSIIEYVNAPSFFKLLMGNEHNDNTKLIEVLQNMKELISQQQWIQMTDTVSSKVEMYLKILLHVPIMYLNPDIRTLIFLVTYSISKECEKNDEISALCNIIFLDLLEKIGIDIFQYIEPRMLVSQLPQNKALSKACEFAIRNVRMYVTLKNLIKSCAQCKETMYTILECIEAVKSKLNAEQKVIFRKAERKLSKTILKILPEKINDAFDVKCLVMILKITIPTGRISDTLKKLTEQTLQAIFTVKENSNNTNDSVLLLQGVQLATVVLRHRKAFDVQDISIRNLWFVMLRHPCETLLEPLLASTGLIEFHELLKLLHDKTISSLLQADEVTWTNVFVIWSTLIKTDMRVKRNKMRFMAINNLFRTVLLSNILDKYWPDLLHLLHEIISVKHLLIPDSTIDLILMVNLESLEKAKILVCENVLALCGTLIRAKTNLITDRLPTLLLLYRSVIKIIVHTSKNIADKFDEHRFRCFGFDIEKLTGSLVKLKKDMTRLSPYLIADLLQLILEGSIPSYIKVALQNSLCYLISICDQHGIALLFRALPMSSQEIFRIQLDTFNKFYKYSGKI